MSSQTKIDAIERRILDEHRKYSDSPVEWARVAAIKILSMFDYESRIKDLEQTDETCERLQQFYGT